FPGVINGSVICNKQFKVRKCLLQNAVNYIGLLEGINHPDFLTIWTHGENCKSIVAQFLPPDCSDLACATPSICIWCFRKETDQCPQKYCTPIPHNQSSIKNRARGNFP